MDDSKWLGALLLLVAANTCLAFDKALHKTKLAKQDTHDIDLYIEQKIGYVHAKIDLRPTIDSLLTLEKATYRLEKSRTNDLSRALAKHMNSKFDRIVNKLHRVNGKVTSRQTRSIEIIGNLISDLFGNPGPADWKKNTANVIAMQTAIQKLSDNSKTEYNDIDQNRHIIEKQNDKLRQLNSQILKGQAEITKVDEDVGFLTVYIELLVLSDAIESNVDALIEIKIDSMKGFCSEKAIEKQFLIDNLQALEANKLGLGPVFGSWEWREYHG